MQERNTGGFPFCKFSQALIYASPAWWGFAGAQDRQNVYSFLRRSARVGFYSSDLPCFHDLCTQADQNLSNVILSSLLTVFYACMFHCLAIVF